MVDKKQDKLSRRSLITTTVKTATAAAVVSKAPYVFAKKPVTLRVMGTHVTLQEELRVQAQKDLGINLQFEPLGDAKLIFRAVTKPESFDIFEQWSNAIKVLFPAGSIQGVEIERLKYWHEINNLTKEGRITPEAKLGAGDAPYKFLYVQKDGTLGSKPSDKISFLPYVHNVDSFGYDTRVIPEGIPYKTESWGWLLDPAYKGKVALINAPTIGLFDMALAAQAAGLVQFRDIGNISRDELDQLFAIFVEKKKQGHFRGVWTSVPQSIDFMARGEVVIESMFSPAISSLKGQNIPAIYAAPKEGYRAWHGVMCLSSKTTGHVKDAAYDYMNWWLSGWPGAFIARQGYYISNPQRSRSFLSDDEWVYWYGGGAARSDLKGTDGNISVQKGEIRTGGTYEQRFSNVAVWNSVIDNYEYSLVKWGELLRA